MARPFEPSSSRDPNGKQSGLGSAAIQRYAPWIAADPLKVVAVHSLAVGVLLTALPARRTREVVLSALVCWGLHVLTNPHNAQCLTCGLQ